MNINLPYKVRLVIYLFTVIMSPVVGYLKVKGYIGDVELGLWTAEVTAVSALAAINVTPDK